MIYLGGARSLVKYVSIHLIFIFLKLTFISSVMDRLSETASGKERSILKRMSRAKPYRFWLVKPSDGI